MDQAVSERQKKIEAGKLKLAKLQRKRKKKEAEKQAASQVNKAEDVPASFSLSESSISDNTSEQIQDTMSQPSSSSIVNDERSVAEGSPQTSAETMITSQSRLSMEEPVSFKEIDDWSSTDDLQALQLYGNKISELQEAISQRDTIIHQLSFRLESVMESLNAFKSRDVQHEAMARDLETYKNQLQQAKEILAKQKNKNGLSSSDYLDLQVNAESVEMSQVPNEGDSSKCSVEIGIQVDNLELPLLPDEDPFICHYSERTDLSFIEKELIKHYQMVILERNDLKQRLVQLQQNIFSEDTISKNTNSDWEHELAKNGEQSFANSLERIIALNNITKTINCLLYSLNCESFQTTGRKSNLFNLQELSTSVIGNGDATMNFYPMQFWKSQSNIDTSNNSIEILRNATFSENLSGVKDFLHQEAKLALSFMDSGQCKYENLAASDGLDNIFYATVDSPPLLGQGDCVSDSKCIAELLEKERSSFEQSIHLLSGWVNNLQESGEVETNVPVPELDIASEELPVSCISLVSFTESERLEKSCHKNTSDFGGKNVPLFEMPIDNPTAERLHTICEESTTHTSSFPVNGILSGEQQHIVISELCESIKSQLQFKLNNVEEVLENYYRVMETSFLDKMERFESVKSKFKLLLTAVKNEHEIEISKLIKDREEETSNLISSSKDLEEKLKIAAIELSKCQDEKLQIESCLNNQIADLVAEHNEDLENIRQNLHASFLEKEKHLEKKHADILKDLQASHQREMDETKQDIEVRIVHKTQKIRDELTEAIAALEYKHSAEIMDYQRKAEHLLERRLVEQGKQVQDAILEQNQKALHELCEQMESQIRRHKEKLEAVKLDDATAESSFSEALDEINYNIRFGINSFLGQDDQFGNNVSTKETKSRISYRPEVSIEERGAEIMTRRDQEKPQMDFEQSESAILANMDSERVNSLVEELNDAKNKAEAKMEFFMREKENLTEELKFACSKMMVLEDCNAKLKKQLRETEAKLQENANEIDSPSVRESLTSPMLSSNDLYNVAQTNSRLLHVLSDAVKTFLEIERDINNRLMEFGLSTGPSNKLMQQDDDTVQSVGSREDFTGIGLNDSSNLELHEDGPDLTPRTWNIVKSMGEYDADAEDEDVVIGTTRRVRLQVDHLLHLLSLFFDKTKEQEFKAVLKRNEELSHELQEECQDRDNMQMNLVNAQSFIRKCESDKRRLEDENFQLCSDKEFLSHEIKSLKLKNSQLDDAKDRFYEEKRLMQAQLELLASRLGDPEKMTSYNEHLSRHVPELLQENTKLSSEKLSIQRNLAKEKQTLATRVHQLELSLDEMTAQKDDIIEKSRREREDLQCQIESVEKQLFSYKKFINEQSAEREQERDDLLKEIKKLHNQMREREKLQNIESQHTKEAENLERQLKTKIEEHAFVVCKKEEVERELRQSMDKVHDLREIIAELEKQLESKSRAEAELKQKLGNALKSLSAHERHVEDLQSQVSQDSSTSLNEDLSETLRNMEEQLASKSQELEQMYQSETLLKELRGRLHFLEAKVDQKTRHVESMNLVSLTASPVLSDDASHGESHDGEQHQVQCEDGWEMSPRSVHWLEVRRLEEKICRLIQIEEELIRQNKEYCSQLRKLHFLEEEWSHEKAALQQQTMDQLLQITQLNTHIDELRQRVQPPINSQALAEMEKLRETLENEQEQRKKSLHEIMDLKHEVNELEVNIREKDHLIQKLQTESHIRRVLCCKHTQTDIPPMSLDIVTSTPKTTESFIPTIWQKLLQEKNNQIDSLTDDLEVVRSQLHQRPCDIQVGCEGSKAGEMYEAVKETQLKLFQTEMELAAIKEEKSSLLMQIIELENERQKNKEELELEQRQLEKDFDTVQDMMQKKEKELSILQEETENQMRLEATNDMLQQQLLEKSIANEELCDRLQALEEELSQEKLGHSSDAEKWMQKAEDLQSKLKALKNQILLLKSKFLLNEDFDDVEIKEVQEKIVDAAAKLQTNDGDSNLLFQEVVYRILQQAVELKTKALKRRYETQIVDSEKSWLQKLTEAEDIRRASVNEAENARKKAREEADLTIEQMQLKFESDLNQLSEKKDLCWKDKLDNMEKSWMIDKENLKHAMMKEYQLNEDVAKKIDKLKQDFQEMHIKETCRLKEIIVKVSKEKSSNEETMRNLHEREKLALLKECESKVFSIGQQLKAKFDKEKIDLEAKQLMEFKNLFEEQKTDANRRHQEELDSVRILFSKKWTEEIQKFQEIHKKELQSLKNSKEKNAENVMQHLCVLYENKFRSIESECEAQLAEEKEKHMIELDRMKEAFEKQKEAAIEQMEQQLRMKLQQKYDKEFLEQLEARELQNLDHKLKVLEATWQKKIANAERKLRSAHQKEIVTAKQNFEVQLNAQKKAHEDYLLILKEQFNGQLKNAQEIIKALKESSATFPKASLSDITSSDDTCSSNAEKVVKKIYGYGTQTLALTENWAQKDKGYQMELQSLREERTLIINRLMDVIVATEFEELNLQLMIEKLIEEVMLARKNDQNINKYSGDQIITTEKQQTSPELLRKVVQQQTRIAWLESVLHQANHNIPPDDALHTNGLSVSENDMQNNVNYSSLELARTEAFCRNSDFTAEGPLLANTSLSKNHTYKLLQWNHRRDRSRIVALIFQKKYLLTLLSAFQATEEITVAMLAQMGVSISNQRAPSDDRPKGCCRFRSAAYVIIALSRMKFLVLHWQRHLANLNCPNSTRKTENLSKESCYKSILVNADLLTCTSSSSVSASSVDDLCAAKMQYNRFSRRNSENAKCNEENGHLIEYVNRLEELHRQLGLDEQR